MSMSRDAMLPRVKKEAVKRKWDLYDFDYVKHGDPGAFRAMFYDPRKQRYIVNMYNPELNRFSKNRKISDYKKAQELFNKLRNNDDAIKLEGIHMQEEVLKVEATWSVKKYLEVNPADNGSW